MSASICFWRRSAQLSCDEFHTLIAPATVYARVHAFVHRLTPFSVFTAVISHCVKKATFFVSNLRGSAQRLSIGGVEIQELFNYVNPGLLSMAVSVMSYAGTTTVAVAANTSAVPDAEQFLDFFCEEVDVLQLATKHAAVE